MVVNIPANQVLAAAENGQPLPDNVHVKYLIDPSNVHHSYLNDRTKFRATCTRGLPSTTSSTCTPTSGSRPRTSRTPATWTAS